MRPMTNVLREQIKMKIKNGQDISDLIKDVEIKNEDLSRAIISKFTRIDSNISGCNLSHTVLGNEQDTFILIRSNIRNCNFEGAKFIGKTLMRSCDARNCNFRNADVTKVSYEHSNFLGSTFCGAHIRLDSRGGMGCLFDEKLIGELTKNWGIEVKVVKRG